jgi:hypothetical protein
MSQDTSSIRAQRSSPKQVQELLDGLAVTAGRGPDQPAGVVVDDDREVALALADRDLVEPQAPKAGQQVALAAGLITDTSADAADRAPCRAHQRRDRAGRRVDRKPRALILERSGEPRPVARPRHRGDDHAVAAALHARRLGLDVRESRAQIHCPPASPAIAPVIARTAPPTDRAAPLLTRARPHAHHDRLAVEKDVLDHRARQPQQPRPYPYPAHVAPPPLVGSRP